MVPTDDTRPLTKTEQKIAQMRKLAEETGFVCEPITKFRQEFLTAINSHLVHRVGKNVYQTPTYTIPMFSREAALKIFGEANLVTNSPTTLTWRIDDLAELSSTFRDMLSETGMLSAGLSRALKTDSQKVVATVSPAFPLLDGLSVCSARVGPRRSERAHANSSCLGRIMSRARTLASKLLYVCLHSRHPHTHTLSSSWGSVCLLRVFGVREWVL